MARSAGTSRLAALNWNRVYSVVGLIFVVAIGYLLWNRQPAGSRNSDIAGIAGTGVRATEPAAPPPLIPSQPARPGVAPADPNTQSQVGAGFAEAMALLRTDPGRLIEVRDRLSEILTLPMSEPQRILIRDQLGQLSAKWLFSRTVFNGDTLCDYYKVKPGDQLRIIADRYKVPYELLMQINGISKPEALKADVSIKVVRGPFHAKVHKSTFTMDLYLQQNTFVKSYPIGHGMSGHETPTGLWVVKLGDKLIKPPWTDPDTGRVYQGNEPDYPLGSRWIGLEGMDGNAVGRTGFAIHGTKDPNTIGKQSSRGCIRLFNGEVIEVYNMLYPGQSQVMVSDN